MTTIAPKYTSSAEKDAPAHARTTLHRRYSRGIQRTENKAPKRYVGQTLAFRQIATKPSGSAHLWQCGCPRSPMSAKSAVCNLALLIGGAALPFGVSQARSPNNEFISLDAAKPVLSTYASSLPEELRPANALTAAKWDTWVQRSDRQVRDRLDRGEEDTLTNLLRFGVTYTKEFRIDDDYLVRYGQSSLVNSFAEKRANDLIRALSAPSTWPANSRESMARMRRLLEKKGFSYATPQQRKNLKTYLFNNLARLRDDIALRQRPTRRRSSSRIAGFLSTRISGLTSCSTSTFAEWPRNDCLSQAPSEESPSLVRDSTSPTKKPATISILRKPFSRLRCWIPSFDLA